MTTAEFSVLEKWIGVIRKMDESFQIEVNLMLFKKFSRNKV